MLANLWTRAALAAGIILASGSLAVADETTRLADKPRDNTTQRLDRKASDVTEEETEEMCRRRRLLRRRFASESYYAPPMTYSSSPPVQYSPPIYDEPRVMPTLPTPAPMTYPQEGAKQPTPMPARRPVPAPATGPSLGPVPSTERMVAQPPVRETLRLKGYR